MTLVGMGMDFHLRDAQVSVMTSEGIEELKHTTVAMLKEHQKLSTGRPWLDVLSKSDLLPLAAEARSYEPSDPSERLEGILSPGDEEPSPLDGIWKAEQRDSERQHEDLRINLHPDAQHQGLEAASDGFAEALSRVAEEMPSAIR
eukprot:gene18471-22041_t